MLGYPMAPRSLGLGQKWISFPPASTAFIGCRVKLFCVLHFREHFGALGVANVISIRRTRSAIPASMTASV
jgi:hypothetical protein